VHSGGLNADDLVAELVVGRDRNGEIEELEFVSLQATEQGGGTLHYVGGIEARHGGSIVYGVRVLPTHVTLSNKYELGLVKWA
jgi:starch phosphorylase